MTVGSSRSWAVSPHPLDEQTLVYRQAQSFSQIGPKLQGLNAQIGAVHFAIGDQILRDAFRCVDGNSETNARSGARWGVNSAVDADHLAAGIEQRAARVSLIDGRVGLNCPVNESCISRLNGAAQGADHAGCESARKSKWIADRKDGLAH